MRHSLIKEISKVHTDIRPPSYKRTRLWTNRAVIWMINNVNNNYYYTSCPSCGGRGVRTIPNFEINFFNCILFRNQPSNPRLIVYARPLLFSEDALRTGMCIKITMVTVYYIDCSFTGHATLGCRHLGFM